MFKSEYHKFSGSNHTLIVITVSFSVLYEQKSKVVEAYMQGAKVCEILPCSKALTDVPDSPHLDLLM